MAGSEWTTVLKLLKMKHILQSVVSDESLVLINENHVAELESLKKKKSLI